MPSFDSVPIILTARALAHNFNLEEKVRREEAQLNKDFYYGKQEQSLTLMNDDVEPIIMNITKPIIQKRTAMLYRRPLIREFTGPQESIAYLEECYLENYIDQFLHKIDLASEMTGSALAHPIQDDTYECGIRLAIFDATQFSAVGKDHDPTVPEAISLIRMIDRLKEPEEWLDQTNNRDMATNPQLERVLQQQIWTPDSVTMYEGAFLVHTEKNDLGFLPFVNFMGEEVPDQFCGHAPATLVRKANHHINQLLTHLGFTIKMQAGTPIVFGGFKSGETVVIHPGRAINIPNDTTAETLALNPKINETLAVIQWLEDKIYTCSSVPRISVEGGEGTSGRELIIRWWPLLQVFQEKAVRYDKYELQLANTILSVAGLEPIEDVDVMWQEQQILPLSPDDENLERNISLNISTPIDEILRRQPQLTDEEAMAKLEENKAINEANAPPQPEVIGPDGQVVDLANPPNGEAPVEKSTNKKEA